MIRSVCKVRVQEGILETSLQHRSNRLTCRKPPRSLKGAALADLVVAQQRLEGSLWSASTQKSLDEMRAKIIAFNQRHYPNHVASREQWPQFVNAQVDQPTQRGAPQFLSASANARLFFTQFSDLSRSTLAGYRWQIQQIYAQNHYGPVPWDVSSGQ